MEIIKCDQCGKEGPHEEAANPAKYIPWIKLRGVGLEVDGIVMGGKWEFCKASCLVDWCNANAVKMH